LQQIPALGCARLNPAYFSWLHELSALKGNNVLGLKFEPFAILALCLEAPVPVGFDADGGRRFVLREQSWLSREAVSRVLALFRPAALLLPIL